MQPQEGDGFRCIRVTTGVWFAGQPDMSDQNKAVVRRDAMYDGGKLPR
jgi:hypothetical protein